MIIDLTEAKGSLVPTPYLAPDKNQAISFKAIKACYPFTIKGWSFNPALLPAWGGPDLFENPDPYDYS